MVQTHERAALSAAPLEETIPSVSFTVMPSLLRRLVSRSGRSFITLALALPLAACIDEPSDYPVVAPPDARTFLDAPAPVPLAEPSQLAATDALQGKGQAVADTSSSATSMERIEERRHYVLRFDTEAPLLRAYHHTLEQCQEHSGCVLESSQSDQQANGVASAWIEIQVPRRGLANDTLIQTLEDSPQLVTAEVRRDDQTARYLDTEARMQQQEILRQRLLDLAEQGRTFSERSIQDLLSLERELARVQGSIESMQARLLVLRDRTDNVRVLVEFQQLRPSPYVDSVLSPLWMALDQSTGVFMRSLGNVILALVFLAPWLVIGLPVIWAMLKLWRGIRRLWRRRRGRADTT